MCYKLFERVLFPILLFFFFLRLYNFWWIMRLWHENSKQFNLFEPQATVTNKPILRSSHPEMLCKKGALTNFLKFIGKHLCQGLFFNKVAARSATLLKKRLWRRCFPVNFAKFLRKTFFTEHLRLLLLYFTY